MCRQKPTGQCRYCHAVVLSWAIKHFDFHKLAALWLARLINNHVRIYGSNVAEGFSVFQRRSCLKCYWCYLCCFCPGLKCYWCYLCCFCPGLKCYWCYLCCFCPGLKCYWCYLCCFCPDLCGVELTGTRGGGTKAHLLIISLKKYSISKDTC